MKHIILTLSALLFIFNTYSQTEVYFSADITEVESLQGVSLHTSVTTQFSNHRVWGGQLQMNYFYEQRILPFSSIIFNAGLATNGTYANSFTSPLFNNIHLSAGMEPRYYFSLSKRTTEARGDLNSGWFLNLPITFSTPLIYPKTYKMNGQLFVYEVTPKFASSFENNFGLGIGHRYALTNHVFLEASLAGNYQTFNFRHGSFKIMLTIKAAYTF